MGAACPLASAPRDYRGGSHFAEHVAPFWSITDTTPSKKRVKRFKKSLRTELHVANHAPLEEVVAAVNHKLRGWSRYFSIGTLEPAYRTVDRYTEALFRQFLVRRHEVPGRGTRPFSNRYLYEELGLVRLGDRRRMSRLHALT